MVVQIGKAECEFRNTHPGIRKMTAWLDESLRETGAELRHLMVDGVKVSEAPFDYVRKRVKDIQKIEVVLRKKPAARRKKDARAATVPLSGPIRVRISNIEFDGERTPEGVDAMFGRIDEAMREFQVYFSHLVVDGAELAEEPYAYLQQHYGAVGEIEVIFLTPQQFLGQVTQILTTFLDNALPNFEQMADQFYQKPDDDTWNCFDLAMDGLKNMIDLISRLTANAAFAQRLDTMRSLGNDVQNSLGNMLGAVNNNDYTLLADLLHYELVPFLQAMHTQLLNLSEEQAHAVN